LPKNVHYYYEKIEICPQTLLASGDRLSTFGGNFITKRLAKALGTFIGSSLLQFPALFPLPTPNDADWLTAGLIVTFLRERLLYPGAEPKRDRSRQIVHEPRKYENRNIDLILSRITSGRQSLL